MNTKKAKIVPGTLVQHKKTGELAFVEHTYAQAFGGRSKALSLLWLDDNGEIECSSAWSYPSQFNILESDIEANLKKIVKYNQEEGEGAPIFMNPKLAAKLGYTSIHTYESARADKKKGDIKLSV